MSSYFEELEQAEAEEEQRLYEEHLCNDCKMAEHFIKKGKTDALSIDMEKPMHFTDEQKAWIKQYIIINAKRQRADVIDEFAKEFHKYIGFNKDINHHDIDFFVKELKGK